MIICPFCGKEYDNSKNPYLNKVYSCNSKYYANTGEWLNHKTGERKFEPNYFLTDMGFIQTR